MRWKNLSQFFLMNLDPKVIWTFRFVSLGYITQIMIPFRRGTSCICWTIRRISIQKFCQIIALFRNTDWWYVKNAKGVSGYVPRNFVAFWKTPQALEWFAGRIPRSVAERLVAERDLLPGTFLIREREADQLEYALTIRDMDQGHGPCVKHYKIKKLDNDQGYFITTRVIFPSLEALVNYYSGLRLPKFGVERISPEQNEPMDFATISLSLPHGLLQFGQISVMRPSTIGKYRGMSWSWCASWGMATLEKFGMGNGVERWKVGGSWVVKN